MNNDAEGSLPPMDWSDKNANDLVNEMVKVLPRLRWLELNADRPNGIFYHPELSVNKFLRIDFESLRSLLGGGSLWGSGIEWNGVLFRATGEARLKRRDVSCTGDAPIWIYLDPSRMGPQHPFRSPGEFHVAFSSRFSPLLLSSSYVAL